MPSLVDIYIIIIITTRRVVLAECTSPFSHFKLWINQNKTENNSFTIADTIVKSVLLTIIESTISSPSQYRHEAFQP